jgi:antitoxin component YwqK of YwqJK toxin-antitoxin module
VLDGEAMKFFENGELEFAVNVVDGQENGKTTYFNEDGSWLSTKEYDMGILISCEGACD